MDRGERSSSVIGTMKGDGLTVAEQVAALPPLSVLLGGGETIAKPFLRSEVRLCGDNTLGIANSKELEEEVLNEVAVWRQIENSLALPVEYRSRGDVAVTLQMLRRMPFFSGMIEEDLLVVAGEMKIEMFSTKGLVIWEKADPGLEELVGDELSDSEGDVVVKNDFDSQSCTSPLGGSSKGLLPSKGPHSDCSSPFATSDCGMYPDVTVYCLARGKVLLALPTVNGMQYHPVLPLDTFGNVLWSNPLPIGSKFIVAEPCLLVRLQPSSSGIGALNYALSTADKLRLADQKRFLRQQVKVPIFESWDEQQLEDCAKRFLPLRLEAFQTIMEEGEASDCLCFLKEGQAGVTRLVKPLSKRPLKAPNVTQDSKGLPSVRLPEPGNSLWPSSLIRQTREPSLGGSEQAMSVASLNPGEFFGELGLLDHDTDVRPGENTIWTDAFWENALSTRFKQEELQGETSFMKELREKVINEISSMSSSVVQIECPRPELNEHIDARYPAVTRNRAATVYAQIPSLMYRISYEDCKETIGGLALTRLLEFVKGYPAHEELFEQFEKYLHWKAYRDKLIADVLRLDRKCAVKSTKKTHPCT